MTICLGYGLPLGESGVDPRRLAGIPRSARPISRRNVSYSMGEVKLESNVPNGM